MTPDNDERMAKRSFQTITEKDPTIFKTQLEMKNQSIIVCFQNTHTHIHQINGNYMIMCIFDSCIA